MSKKTKMWLIIATLLVLVGGMIFGSVMTMLKWDFKKIQTVRYETNAYDVDEKYKEIKIKADTADIEICASKDGKTSVVCYEQENEKHSVSVKEGVLFVENNDERKWYEHVGVGFETPSIRIFIPQGECGPLLIKLSTGDIKIPRDFTFESVDISGSTGNVMINASAVNDMKIKTSTGNICVEDVTVGELMLSVTTGHIKVSNVKCQGDAGVNVSTGKVKLVDAEFGNLVSKGTTGGLLLEKVFVSKKLTIKRSTGDVEFKKADAEELFVETETGDVEGELMTDKVFITHTSTGKVKVPKTVTGGKCEIKTSTGDIKIEIKKGKSI